MANILYLVHRLPYPPDKGEKARAFHTLKHLAKRHRVLLGTFVDSAQDVGHVDKLKGLCAEVCAVRLHPRWAKLASLRGLLRGQALTVPYYGSARLRRWVSEVTAGNRIDAALVYSSCMGQFTGSLDASRVLVDFVDVDSAKWGAYALQHRWPMSWLYRREGVKLLAWERKVASRATHSFFVTEREAELFRSLAPESEARVSGLSMGVDADYFAPDEDRASPFGPQELPLVFTGSMDYWPNADAAVWFATEVLPGLRAAYPTVRFHVVGRNPTGAVQALASESVAVTGTVADVRPYLQHAAAVVAPLRLARGIQTKILEAMSMGRPVVAAQACAEVLNAQPGRDLLPAASVQDYQSRIGDLLSDRAHARAIGEAGRACVLRHYDWAAHLSQLDAHIDRAVANGKRA